MNINLVNGSNFANFSDVIYSQVIETDKFKSKKNDDVYILDENDKYVFYKLNKFTVKTNDVIYCNSLLLECLFRDLKKLKNVTNLKLITSQSDRLINKKTIRNIPDSISEYYAINISTSHIKLKSLPLGIANDYSPKNLLSKDLSIPISVENSKEKKLYLNFNELTNIKHRKNLKEYFIKFNWAVVRKESISLEEYKNDIKNYQFILCPWGNGIDTHRIWEALYLGSTPVVKWHNTFECIKNLPVIFFDHYEEIDILFLENKFKNLKNLDIKKDFLEIEYWINQIKQNKVDENHKEVIQSSELYLKLFLLNRQIKLIINRNIKKIKFRLYQISKKLN